MKIHYYSAETWERDYVASKLQGDEVVFHTNTLQASEHIMDEDAEVISVFIDSKVGETEMNLFPKLRLITTRSTGFDHIDLAAAKARNIAVANVPFYGENTVAEFAMALVLGLSRKIVDADESVRERGKFSQDGLRGFDLRGKTMGIIGVGHIGMHVIRMAKGFEMNVLAFDVHESTELASRLGFTYAPLEKVLAESDVVSIHVPYNAHTHHLINKENIKTMKRGALLINTARGAVVETESLVVALQEGILGGAGLDVLEEEGELAAEDVLLASAHPNEAMLRMTLANHYLIKHPRVIVTPHVAFNTNEAVHRIVDTTLEIIHNFKNNVPLNLVTS